MIIINNNMNLNDMNIILLLNDIDFVDVKISPLVLSTDYRPPLHDLMRSAIFDVQGHDPL